MGCDDPARHSFPKTNMKKKNAKLIIREVGAFGLWEAVDPRWKRFIAGGFTPQQAEHKARLVLARKQQARERYANHSRPLR